MLYTVRCTQIVSWGPLGYSHPMFALENVFQEATYSTGAEITMCTASEGISTMLSRLKDIIQRPESAIALKVRRPGSFPEIARH